MLLTTVCTLEDWTYHKFENLMIEYETIIKWCRSQRLWSASHVERMLDDRIQIIKDAPKEPIPKVVWKRELVPLKNIGPRRIVARGKHLWRMLYDMNVRIFMSINVSYMVTNLETVLDFNVMAAVIFVTLTLLNLKDVCDEPFPVSHFNHVNMLLYYLF